MIRMVIICLVVITDVVGRLALRQDSFQLIWWVYIKACGDVRIECHKVWCENHGPSMCGYKGVCEMYACVVCVRCMPK